VVTEESLYKQPPLIGGVVRFNVVVSRELHQQMQQLKEKINWSAVARVAFRKLLETEKEKEQSPTKP
jgi:post-segregation antitoxin (ccd killing protein)